MDEGLATVATYVTRRLGLVLSATQLSDLEQYVGRRRQASADFLARLDDPEELRALVDCLTVKETFFNRYEAQFEAFQGTVLPNLLARARAERRPVRLWSAGCCTGEEPYTLAVLAAEAGCAGEVEILATDVNAGYLEAALRREYSRRSVGKLPPALVARYFEARGDRFVLQETLAARVTFKWLNLAEAGYPSFLNGTSAFDMIFCRNVLIYFEKTLVREIIGRFAECLSPGGLLALGHSEILPRDWPLSVAPFGDAFFYEHPRTAARGAAREREAEADAAAKPPRPDRARPRPARKAPAAPPPAAKPDPRALLAAAEAKAQAGDSRAATKLCREAIRADASLERGHYLLGLLLLDDPALAHEHFRKAVYLDPAHLPARLHLAECAEKLGRVSEAVLEYRNLERLARSMPPGQLLDAAEGTTYGMLALIGRNALNRHEGGSR